MLFKKSINKEVLLITFLLGYLSIFEVYILFFSSANEPSIVQAFPYSAEETSTVPLVAYPSHEPSIDETYSDPEETWIVPTLDTYTQKEWFIFPKSFDEKRYNEYKNKLSGSTYYKFDGSRSPDKIFQASETNKDFHQHDITIYHSNRNINEDITKCPELLHKTNGIFVDRAKVVDMDLVKALRNFMTDLPNNEYYQEIAPYFIDHLEEQFANGLEYLIPKYWFQLAGSSLWLEEYGVHFMIRRVMYCPSGIRFLPKVSLTYAQIFDEDWNELENTNLIMPDDMGIADRGFEKFPKFLEVPFFHDVTEKNIKYYGAEDPRITKYRNKFGYNEPLIIFNAVHRKFEENDKGEKEAKFYRSMWACFPFKSQKGKLNTDGSEDEQFSKTVYSKVAELRIKDMPRQLKEKNWTPFISYDEQTQQNLEDTNERYVYFISRWLNFQVLKCDVMSGLCDFEYKLYPSLPSDAPVGDLRGGTELISIKELMIDLGIDTRYYLPPDREVWIGFARAHINDCGCGPLMYRPNLVLVVKDRVKKQDSETEYELVYKISHVASFASFDINVIGWDFFEPQKLCDRKGSSILIPNGISSWVINREGQGDDKIVDYLTLTFSVSDFNVERINIKNLLAEVVKLEDVFLRGDNKHYIPKTADPSKELGYNNDNVLCAVKNSRDFCVVYSSENPY